MFVHFVEENTNSNMVECDNLCGNYTHPSIRVCGDCLNEGEVITYKNQRSIASTRRFFNSIGG
jgi:hypothetical protein